MKKLLNKLLRERSTEFYVAGILLWLLPGLILGVLGLVYLWQAGWFWWFSAGLLVLAALSWGVRRVLAKPEEQPDESPQHLDPRPEWSDHDRQVWQTSIDRIEEAGLATTPWDDIPQAMFDQLTFVARVYHGDSGEAEFAFSLPELLLMLETWSREYRAQVVQNMPLAHDVKISTLRTMSRRADTALRIYSYVSPFISALRIGINPVTGLAREFSSQLATKYMGDLGQLMQKNIRVVLFEQVTQVGIDLYSGRLKFSEEELLAYRNAQQKPEEIDIKPLSVFVVGQLNAGKSSLINELKQQYVAETDALPATSGFHYHPLMLENDVEIYLVDSPGFDGKKSTSKVLLREVVKADLILWVSQANQPAKALDKQFLEQWNEYFAEHLARKKPPMLLVTTHNDRLPPVDDWQPPYDLKDLASKKVRSMLAALDYSHEAIGLPKDSWAVPVSLPGGEDSFNLDVLQSLLIAVSDEARAAQLNRQRLDAGTGVLKAINQTAGLVKVGVKLALK
jgi:predicted GTPase